MVESSQSSCFFPVSVLSCSLLRQCSVLLSGTQVRPFPGPVGCFHIQPISDPLLTFQQSSVLLRAPLLPSKDFLENFVPSHPCCAFGGTTVPCTPLGRGRSGFLLHTVTGFLRSELTHYYGLICHLLQLRFGLTLILPSSTCAQDCNRLPQLLYELPVNNPILNHIAGLTRFQASRYFARLPTCTAVSGSLSLCTVHFLLLPSDPSVAGDALAIRIIFPLVGAMPASSGRPGLPASLGKQKTAPKGGVFPDFIRCTFYVLSTSFLSSSTASAFMVKLCSSVGKLPP